MIRTRAKFTNQSRRVVEEAERAKYETLRHGALSIRKDASKSIKQRKDKDKEAPPGEPPRQHKPGFLKRALWAHWSEDEAIAGFRASRVDIVAATHEHGLTEEGRDYPERETMQPALERNLDRFHKDWRAAIG